MKISRNHPLSWSNAWYREKSVMWQAKLLYYLKETKAVLKLIWSGWLVSSYHNADTLKIWITGWYSRHHHQPDHIVQLILLSFKFLTSFWDRVFCYKYSTKRLLTVPDREVVWKNGSVWPPLRSILQILDYYLCGNTHELPVHACFSKAWRFFKSSRRFQISLYPNRGALSAGGCFLLSHNYCGTCAGGPCWKIYYNGGQAGSGCTPAWPRVPFHLFLPGGYHPSEKTGISA